MRNFMTFMWFAKIVGTNKKHIMKQIKINVPEGYQIDKDKSTFENIVFKKKKGLPKSWEDLKNVSGYWVHNYCGTVRFDGQISHTNRNTFKTKEQAEASIALAQLSQLRDVYRQGWKPDWVCNKTMKNCIIFYDDAPYVDDFANYHNFLSFQDKETAELFLKNFRDLIEQAKPLMS